MKFRPDSQLGFRSGIFTNGAVHELTNFIITKTDYKEKHIDIFIDLAKAFDTMSVPLLVSKLEIHGVIDTQLKKIHSYLISRRRVRITSGKSNDKLRRPLRSIVGPTLFLVFINSLYLP